MPSSSRRTRRSGWTSNGSFTPGYDAALPVDVPTYGFSPLKLLPEERFLDRFHGIDERLSLSALRFGLPVLYDVTRRFCG